MSEHTLKEIKTHPAYKELVRARARATWPLAILMLVVYFSYILVIAFAPDLFAIKVIDDAHTTWGIVIGLGVILFSFLLTGIYVRIANKKLEPLTEQLQEKIEEE